MVGAAGAGVEEHVRRLHVTVDQARRVGRVEGEFDRLALSDSERGEPQIDVPRLRRLRHLQDPGGDGLADRFRGGCVGTMLGRLREDSRGDQHAIEEFREKVQEPEVREGE